MEIRIDEHPSTISQRIQFAKAVPPITDRPLVATDQMAIYGDDDLIGFASNVEGGCINLIVAFDDDEAEQIKSTVSGLMGITHKKLSVVPDVNEDEVEAQIVEGDDDEISD